MSNKIEPGDVVAINLVLDLRILYIRVKNHNVKGDIGSMRGIIPTSRTIRGMMGRHLWRVFIMKGRMGRKIRKRKVLVT